MKHYKVILKWAGKINDKTTYSFLRCILRSRQAGKTMPSSVRLFFVSMQNLQLLEKENTVGNVEGRKVENILGDINRVHLL